MLVCGNGGNNGGADNVEGVLSLGKDVCAGEQEEVGVGLVAHVVVVL